MGRFKTFYLIKKNDFDTINYIYVVSKSDILKGVLSIKEVFRQNKNKLVSEVMETKFVSVRGYTDQERVAFKALKNNIKAIPVVDKIGHLLGVVPPDVILNILSLEYGEDILRSVGIRTTPSFILDTFKASIFTHLTKRFPWLLVGLFGGILAAFIISFFEDVLESQLILAAFIPAVAYMAGAVSAQTQTLFIRSIAFDLKLNIKKYFIKETKITLFLAIILGILFSIIAFLWQKSIIIGLIMGISIFLTIIFSMVIAIFLPWILVRKKIDPAIASGPFATAVCDIISIILYFSIAHTILSFLS